jgi:hypothetical protein
MSKSDTPPLDLSKFFDSSTNKFKRIEAGANDVNKKASVASVGLLAGAVDYLAGPILFGVDKSGNQDEISAVLAIVAGVFVSSIKDIRQLCSDEPEKGLEGNLNNIKAGVGGIFGGLTLAALTPQILLSLVDGGIILGCTLATMGYSAYQNYSKKKKYCKHEGCKAKGKCSQSVCRQCKRLFYPEDRAVDCSKIYFLDWYDIACFLDAQGLSYLDAELLVEKHIQDWDIYKNNGNIQVDCESFLKWVKTNKPAIIYFKNKGSEKLGYRNIDDYLREKGL